MLAPYRRTVLRRAPEDGGRNYERYSRVLMRIRSTEERGDESVTSM